MIDIQAIRSV